MGELIIEMAQSVKMNLQKNGFPANSVGFPLDKLYESAHNKGIHFNKVRELLEKDGILSKIESSRIVFYPSGQTDTSSFDHKGPLDYKEMLKNPQFANMLKDPQFMTRALDMLSNMGNEELTQMASMVPGIDLSQLSNLREKLRTISPEEKVKLGEMAKKWSPDHT